MCQAKLEKSVKYCMSSFVLYDNTSTTVPVSLLLNALECVMPYVH